MNEALTGSYRYFAKSLFVPTLGENPPDAMMSISKTTKSQLAFCSYDYWTDGDDQRSWVAIGPQAIDPDDMRFTMSIIIHEMVHALDGAHRRAAGKEHPKGGYHPVTWFAIMEQLGVPGRAFSKSKCKVTHDIVDGGPFDIAFQRMPAELLLPLNTRFRKAEKKKTKQGVRVPYRCACEPVVRGPGGLIMTCNICDQVFVEGA